MARRLTGATVAPDLDPDPGFDATFGYDLARLLTIGVPDTEPDDLDAFWAGVKREADAVDPLPELGKWRRHSDRHEVADIAFASLDGVRIGGWLVRPYEGVTRGLVVGHGYGGREVPDGWLPDGAAGIYPVARGLPTRSLTAGFGNTSETHVLTGIGSPRAYSHVGSTADHWIAGRVLRDLVPGVQRLDYVGGSFGGGIGVFTLAYGVTFASGVLEVPSFGHHPLRLTRPCLGSGRRSAVTGWIVPRSSRRCATSTRPRWRPACGGRCSCCRLSPIPRSHPRDSSPSPTRSPGRHRCTCCRPAMRSSPAWPRQRRRPMRSYAPSWVPDPLLPHP